MPWEDDEDEVDVNTPPDPYGNEPDVAEDFTELADPIEGRVPVFVPNDVWADDDQIPYLTHELIHAAMNAPMTGDPAVDLAAFRNAVRPVMDATFCRVQQPPGYACTRRPGHSGPCADIHQDAHADNEMTYGLLTQEEYIQRVREPETPGASYTQYARVQQPASTPWVGLTGDVSGPAVWQPTTLYIDPANTSGNASNENTGLSRSAPFLSYAEVQRRLELGEEATVHIMSTGTAPMEFTDFVDPTGLRGRQEERDRPNHPKQKRNRDEDLTAWQRLLSDDD